MKKNKIWSYSKYSKQNPSYENTIIKIRKNGVVFRLNPEDIKKLQKIFDTFKEWNILGLSIKGGGKSDFNKKQSCPNLWRLEQCHPLYSNFAFYYFRGGKWQNDLLTPKYLMILGF